MPNIKESGLLLNAENSTFAGCYRYPYIFLLKVYRIWKRVVRRHLILILDSFFSETLDTKRWILDSNAQYSGFHKQKFPEFRNLDDLTWGDR